MIFYPILAYSFPQWFSVKRNNTTDTQNCRTHISSSMQLHNSQLPHFGNTNRCLASKLLDIPSTLFSFARPQVKPGNQLRALHIISAPPKAAWSYLSHDRGAECFICALFGVQVKALQLTQMRCYAADSRQEQGTDWTISLGQSKSHFLRTLAVKFLSAIPSEKALT